ncbi:type I polyketide synthase [Bordetella genomosp. 13]|uniref:Beta-ketoacyl synthase n=1 Tax=Bordetella genomosp. 13 TaxID=463040 RepID=A0A1W6Z9T5_9BORD|nr:type I polyketide synthase [Bordetella genomosp. 13]ARP94077.1 beta-ketoacyl synthase [Bordetella genomosp. 13]
MAKRVAIVGMSFRFPSTNTQQYWNDLLEGKDLVTEVAPDRWSRDAYLHPGKEHPGTSYTFSAGSLGDVSGFDADFFGISPREAALMDPQQRVLLELCWEAIENAGVRPSAMRGTDCGVYIGIASADYSYRLAEDFNALDASFATGNTASIAANRLSYVFDLHGPSMAVDTACSSALVAFHQACRAISNGEISQAIAGGISLHLHPYGFITFSKASMLSPHGRCRVFDAAGDGYVRSEGGGLFLLKDYEQAVNDGNTILAVVAGTSVNTDGRKSGLTVPNPDAQIALMRQIYDEAGIAASDIDYIEAHGTGTPVGDPIEARAIGFALGQLRPTGTPLPIGSIKSNLGHLEAASGVAGLVKAIYSLRHRVVPATIGISALNPHICFDEWNIEVVTRARKLRDTGTLTIGVNSFGFGGSNAHAILQTPPKLGAPRAAELTNTAAIPVVISGRTKAALQDAARGMAQALRSHSPRALYDVAYHAAHRRDWHEERAVVYGNDNEAIAQLLEQFAQGEAPSHHISSGQRLGDANGPVFVYSGNGSQWLGMGRKLMTDPVFAETVEQIDTLFAQHADWSIAQRLRRTDGPTDYERTEIAQPALFAVQLGITRMLAQRGVRPEAVVGHSVGEVAAAWACGALSLDDAVAVIFHRSRLQGATRGHGRMAAVGIDGISATALIAQLGLEDAVCVAGSNSTRGATLAGDPAALERIGRMMAEQRLFYRLLDLDYAFHSSAMDTLKTPLLEALSSLTPGENHTPYFSTVTGAEIHGTQLDAAYWWHNIRQPVCFEQALAQLAKLRFNVYAEIGPHPVLRSYVNDALKAASLTGRVVVTATRGDDDPIRVRDAAGQLLLSGASIDWSFLFPWAGRHVTLPSYPWQRERHWHPVTPQTLGQLERKRVHELLGYRLRQHDHTWENQLDTQSSSWLADHVVGDATVFPGSGFAELALAVALQWQPAEFAHVEEIEIHAPLLLNAAPSKLVRLSLDTSDGRFAVLGNDVGSSAPWTRHASGRVLAEAGSMLLDRPAPALPDRPHDFTGQDHVALTKAAGLDYGPAFQAVARGWVESPGAVVATLRPDTVLDASLPGSLLHPALLDCTFQLIIHMLKDDSALGQGIAFVPAKIGRLRWQRGGVPQIVQARLLARSPHSLTAEFALFDEQGRQIAIVQDARFRSVRLSRTAADHLSFLDYAAVPCPHPTASAEVNAALRTAAMRGALAEVVRHAEADRLHQRYVHEVDPLLESLCDRFAAHALYGLSTDGRLSAAVVRSRRDAAPEVAALLDWLIARAERSGDLSSNGRGDLSLAAPQDGDPHAADIWNSLVREYPDYFAIVHAVGRIGLHLPEVLAGTRPAADLYPRGVTPTALIQQVLGEDASQRIGAALRQRLVHAMQTRSAGQRIAVLEIGGPQPLFAHDICHVLDPASCDYVYATPSRAALEDAVRLQERYPDLRTCLIDAAEPAACVSADLAILHCDFDTPEAIEQVLRYTRANLKPGGTLILRGFHPAAWLDFIFGAQQTWWTSGVDGGNTSIQYPLAYWQALLIQCGFHCEQPLEFVPGAAGGPYLLTARRDEKLDTTPTATSEGGWLLLSGSAPSASRQLADGLAAGLAEAGTPVLIREACPPAELSALLAQVQPRLGRIQGIVLLDGLALDPNATDARQILDTQVYRCALAAGLAQACEHGGLTTTLWLLTAGAAPFQTASAPTSMGPWALNDAALWNYGRTLINEVAGFSVRLVDLPQQGGLSISALLREFLSPDAEQEIVLGPDGTRQAPRLRHNARPAAAAPAAQDDGAVRLDFELPGQLRNLKWTRHPLPEPGPEQLQIRIQATGLNFRDVMYALGLLSDEAIENGFAGPTLGLEFSGVVERVGSDVSDYRPGDAVVGFGPASFGTRALTHIDAVSRIPEGMSFEAAATIPSTFFTVYYALHHLARLEEGEKVLIHGAAGGVGIAAIQYAQWRGAEIHATAGSDEKRDFLRLMGVEYVYDSRSLSFADEILARTGGKGVDVVLNSLAGEAINRNLQVLKPFGRFLELGKRDFYENTRIGLRPFRNNISYFGIDADQLMQERPALTRKLFAEVMALFHEGVLHPLPYQAFDANNVVDAFRHMQQARQIGKIVVTYRNGIRDVRATAAPSAKLALSPDATYLVTGGLSGFGLRTAQWLADKGARHLVLLSRSGATSDVARTLIAALQARGVTVHAQACDVTDRGALAAVLAHVDARMPPLRGLVHAAMVIDDGLVRSADAAQIERVLAPKVLGALHLDALTRGLPLDFFVLYSSGTTLFGNPGQANYVAANGWLEALARQRRANGLPATCVRWGAIDDVGYLARNKKVKDALQSRMGGSALSSEAALQVLEDMLLADASDLGVLELDWRALTRFLPSANSPKFAWAARRAGTADADDAGSVDIAHILATLNDEELHPVFMDMLKSEVGEILRVPAEKIDPERSIYDMGLDSLMGVELVVALENRFGIRLPVMALNESPTISRLARKLIELLRGEGAEQPDAVTSQVAQVVAQHVDDDVPSEVVAQIADQLKAAPQSSKQRMIH